SIDVVLAEADVQLRACQSERFGGLRLVEMCVVQRFHDQRALDGLEIASHCSGCRRRRYGRRWQLLRRRSQNRSRTKRQMFRGDESPVTENGRALQRVSQLADIAGPLILKQRLSRLARNASPRPPNPPPPPL